MSSVKRITTTGKKTKALIKKYSRDFNGKLTDKEAMKLIGVSQNTYYKYKKILANETYVGKYEIL